MSEPRAQGLGPCRVLVVDDDGSVRHMVTRCLQKDGHPVLTAKNGYEPLSVVQSDNPDAFVLDRLMPGMEGLETLRALRERGIAVPIVALSGGSRLESTLSLTFAGKLGAAAVLTKPFELASCANCFATSRPRRPERQRPRQIRAGFTGWPGTTEARPPDRSRPRGDLQRGEVVVRYADSAPRLSGSRGVSRMSE